LIEIQLKNQFLITYDGVDLAEAEAAAESSRRIAIAGRPTVDLAIENSGYSVTHH